MFLIWVGLRRGIDKLLYWLLLANLNAIGLLDWCIWVVVVYLFEGFLGKGFGGSAHHDTLCKLPVLLQLFYCWPSCHILHLAFRLQILDRVAVILGINRLLNLYRYIVTDYLLLVCLLNYNLLGDLISRPRLSLFLLLAILSFYLLGAFRLLLFARLYV